VKNNENRTKIWTILLGVNDVDVYGTYGSVANQCKEIDVDIIDKDVPRSLHELYPDEKEKVS
jgi:hypothetical protein